MFEFTEFDPYLSEVIISQLVLKHKIKIRKWRKQNSGTASISKREIEAPKPITLIGFGICLHEIKHIIDGHWGERYQEEFECEMYAIDFIKSLGWDYLEYTKTANWYVLRTLSKKWNQGDITVDEIDPFVIMYFSELDFDEWTGRKVKVWHDSTAEFWYKIQYYGVRRRVTFAWVRDALEEMGFLLQRHDDPIQGHFLVSGWGKYEEYYTLKQIVIKYEIYE